MANIGFGVLGPESNYQEVPGAKEAKVYGPNPKGYAKVWDAMVVPHQQGKDDTSLNRRTPDYKFQYVYGAEEHPEDMGVIDLSQVTPEMSREAYAYAAAQTENRGERAKIAIRYLSEKLSQQQQEQDQQHTQTQAAIVATASPTTSSQPQEETSMERPLQNSASGQHTDLSAEAIPNEHEQKYIQLLREIEQLKQAQGASPPEVPSPAPPTPPPPAPTPTPAPTPVAMPAPAPATSSTEQAALLNMLSQLATSMATLEQKIATPATPAPKSSELPLPVQREPEQEQVQTSKDQPIPPQDLGILNFGIEPQVPEVSVQFDLGLDGPLKQKYHWIVISKPLVCLVYDTRFPYGECWEPPKSSNPMRLQISRGNYKESLDRVYSRGLTLSFGIFKFCLLIAEEETVENDD